MKYYFSGHVFERMAERGFSPNVIKSVIENGTVIKTYSDDKPFPSKLILGFDSERPVHVVSAYNFDNDTEYVITVYEPDSEKWTDNFSKRKN